MISSIGSGLLRNQTKTNNEKQLQFHMHAHMRETNSNQKQTNNHEMRVVKFCFVCFVCITLGMGLYFNNNNNKMNSFFFNSFFIFFIRFYHSRLVSFCDVAFIARFFFLFLEKKNIISLSKKQYSLFQLTNVSMLDFFLH